MARRKAWEGMYAGDGDRRVAIGLYAALQAVAEAKRKGILPLLDGSIKCTDCDKPARCYDHRDYNEPLKVDPVCQGCNVRRGPAIPLRRDVTHSHELQQSGLQVPSDVVRHA
jgi:hypothetical protein